MKVTFRDIQPLLDDSSIVHDRMLCKFRDPENNRVVLSAVSVDSTAESRDYRGILGKTLARLNVTRYKRWSSSEQAAILKAFEKVNYLFEQENGRIRIKQL